MYYTNIFTAFHRDGFPEVVSGAPVQSGKGANGEFYWLAVGRRQWGETHCNHVIVDRGLMAAAQDYTGSPEEGDCRLILGQCHLTKNGGYVIRQLEGHASEAYVLLFESAAGALRLDDRGRILTHGTIRGERIVLLIRVDHHPLRVTERNADYTLAYSVGLGELVIEEA